MTYKCFGLVLNPSWIVLEFPFITFSSTIFIYPSLHLNQICPGAPYMVRNVPPVVLSPYFLASRIFPEYSDLCMSELTSHFKNTVESNSTAMPVLIFFSATKTFQRRLKFFGIYLYQRTFINFILYF